MVEAPAACPVATTTRLIGGRWKARLLWALFRKEPMRSKELKELEAAALVVRCERPGLPPRTDYSLTERGRTLEPVMAAMAGWGLKQVAEPR